MAPGRLDADELSASHYGRHKYAGREGQQREHVGEYLAYGKTAKDHHAYDVGVGAAGASQPKEAGGHICDVSEDAEDQHPGGMGVMQQLQRCVGKQDCRL